jgi:hypothetical protein
VETFQLILLALAVLALLSIFWSTLSLGISPVPTAPKVRRETMAILPEDLEGEVYELGAGWGTIAWAVAKRYPKARVIAYERSPVPFLFCKLRKVFQPRSNVELHFADLFTANLSNAKLTLAFLWTGGMVRLGKKMEEELPSGAYVVSHTFAWRGKTPELTRTADDLWRTKIYRYRMP